MERPRVLRSSKTAGLTAIVRMCCRAGVALCVLASSSCFRLGASAAQTPPSDALNFNWARHPAENESGTFAEKVHGIGGPYLRGSSNGRLVTPDGVFFAETKGTGNRARRMQGSGGGKHPKKNPNKMATCSAKDPACHVSSNARNTAIVTICSVFGALLLCMVVCWCRVRGPCKHRGGVAKHPVIGGRGDAVVQATFCGTLASVACLSDNTPPEELGVPPSQPCTPWSNTSFNTASVDTSVSSNHDRVSIEEGVPTSTANPPVAAASIAPCPIVSAPIFRVPLAATASPVTMNPLTSPSVNNSTPWRSRAAIPDEESKRDEGGDIDDVVATECETSDRRVHSWRRGSLVRSSVSSVSLSGKRLWRSRFSLTGLGRSGRSVGGDGGDDTSVSEEAAGNGNGGRAGNGPGTSSGSCGLGAAGAADGTAAIGARFSSSLLCNAAAPDSAGTGGMDSVGGVNSTGGVDIARGVDIAGGVDSTAGVNSVGRANSAGVVNITSYSRRQRRRARMVEGGGYAARIYAGGFNLSSRSSSSCRGSANGDSFRDMDDVTDGSDVVFGGTREDVFVSGSAARGSTVAPMMTDGGTVMVVARPRYDDVSCNRNDTTITRGGDSVAVGDADTDTMQRRVSHGDDETITGVNLTNSAQNTAKSGIAESTVSYTEHGGEEQKCEIDEDAGVELPVDNNAKFGCATSGTGVVHKQKSQNVIANRYHHHRQEQGTDVELPKARALWRAFSEVDHDQITENHRRSSLRHQARTSLRPMHYNPPLWHMPVEFDAVVVD